MDDKTVLVVKDAKINELIAEVKNVVNELQEINTRQLNESHKGKKWTFLTVSIMTLAFYVEIVKMDDISILRDRALDFVYSIINTDEVN